MNNSQTVRSIWCALAAVLFGVCLWRAVPADSPNRVAEARPTSQQQTRAVKPIEEIRVGERIAPIRNPDGSFDDSLGTEVNLKTWRKLTLQVAKQNGGLVQVELLRPLAWIKDHLRNNGRYVYIFFDEIGIDDSARLLDLAPCPPITDGTGPIVIGTFHHTESKILSLYIEDSPPIGVTGVHPIWSETRHAFVPAGKLKAGESIRTGNGLGKVQRVENRGTSERVYNLEILGEHVFRVGQEGLLVHNSGNSNNNPIPCGDDLVDLFDDGSADIADLGESLPDHRRDRERLGISSSDDELASTDIPTADFDAGETAKVGPHTVGRYKDVKGHHPHQQAARSNNPNYDPDDALTMADDGTFDHDEVTRQQAKLNAEARRANRNHGTPYDLDSEEDIQVKAMTAGGVREDHAETILKMDRARLAKQGALQPTRIPGQRKGS